MVHISCVGRLLLMFASPTWRTLTKSVAFLCAIPHFLVVIAFAQPQNAPSPPPTLWDHNGSVMYLVENGASREFYYQKPRPGMLEAGAHPDSSYSEVKSPTDTSPEPHFFLTQTAGKFLSLSEVPFSIMAKGLC